MLYWVWCPVSCKVGMLVCLAAVHSSITNCNIGERWIDFVWFQNYNSITIGTRISNWNSPKVLNYSNNHRIENSITPRKFQSPLSWVACVSGKTFKEIVWTNTLALVSCQRLHLRANYTTDLKGWAVHSRNCPYCLVYIKMLRTAI